VAEIVVLVDLLALRAHRELARVPRRHPHLAAERPDRSPHHHRLHDLVAVGVVREPFVVTLLHAVVGALFGEGVITHHRSGHPAIVPGLVVSGPWPSNRCRSPTRW